MAASGLMPYSGQAADDSEQRLAVGVLAPALVAILCVAALAVGSLSLLSALRGYAAGESVWSQARSEAVDALRDFARSRDGADYRRFEQALTVPLADRAAREELERPHPDLERVRQSLLAGDNHPADIDGMLMLYRRFGSLGPFQASLKAWREGDELVERLRVAARELRERAGSDDLAALNSRLADISRLNTALGRTERRFSRELQEAARFVEKVLIGSVLAIALVLAGLGLWLTRRSLRRRAARERALAEANERWMLAAEAGGLGLYDWFVTNDELRMDAKAAAMYGLGDGDGGGVVVRRRTLTALLHPEDLAQTSRLLDQSLASNSRFRARYRVRLPEGELRHLEATGVMQVDADGGARMVGVVRDVTEEERRVQLAHERDMADRAARARMEFLSRLSHELRTPLNAILGFAQLLAMDSVRPLDAAQTQRVRHIIDGGDQLLKLVEDVLDLTRIDAGTIAVKLEAVDVCAAVRTALALVEGLAQSFSVELVNETPGQPVCALADRGRLQQVLVNLLSNGCKYNKPGGKVTVRAWREGDDRIRLSVSDTGIGITEAERAELFQPFRRLPSTASRVEGTGLGLFIVKALVERMGGHIELSSLWGAGTSFTVALPAAPAPGEPDATTLSM